MIALFLAPLYILLNFYLARWLLRWMGACTKHFRRRGLQIFIVVVYCFISSSILTAFLLPWRWLKYVANTWFGTACYILLTVIIVDGIRLLLKYVFKVKWDWLGSRKTFVRVGTICIAIILSLSVYGTLNARYIRITDYQVDLAKETPELDGMRIVLVADLHLGYNKGLSQMTQMVRKINEQEPDLVVIAGDIFDNEFEAINQPAKIAKVLRQIKSTYGTYACYGNHDIEEKILAGFTFSSKEKKMASPEMDQFLVDAGVTLLRDDGVTLPNGVQLYGRADRERPGRGIETRKTPEEITANLDQEKPIFIIDHEPDELEELASAGVDLDLAGHTHNGQMWPGTLTIGFFWENPYGELKVGDMTNIVTSGVGVFGANMRVGTKAEIAVITIGDGVK
ncbi:putative MPP superfamily phosphohydrolase [Lachnospiraceae bacterium PF1-21]